MERRGCSEYAIRDDEEQGVKLNPELLQREMSGVGAVGEQRRSVPVRKSDVALLSGSIVIRAPHAGSAPQVEDGRVLS